MGNIIGYLLVRDEGIDTAANDLDNPESSDLTDVSENSENIENTVESVPEESSQTTEIPTEPTVSVTSAIAETTIPDREITETQSVSETTADVTTSSENAGSQNAEITENNQVDTENTVKVFSKVPARFNTLQFPSTLEMTDIFKQNIKNLDTLATKSFNGSMFYILTTNAKLFTPSNYGGGALNDARYYRTSLVQRACDVVVGAAASQKETISDAIEQSVLAGDYTSDIICVPLDVQSILMQKGLLVNLKKIPFLNLNAEYYNQSAMDAFTVNNNTYGLVSDATFEPSDIYAMFYNKALIKKYNLKSPAEMYDNGEWTYDNMFGLSKSFTAAVADLNNANTDSEPTEAYAVGFNKENNSIINGLFISSGNNYFIEQEYSFPILNFNNDKSRSLINILANIFAPANESGIANYLDTNEDNQMLAFKNGKILFSVAKLDIIPDITNSSFDWGILPVPYLDANQAEANNSLSFTDSNAMCIAVLKGAKNTEICGMVTEALAASSYKYLREMYIRDQMLYRLRDVDSVKVLSDIVNGETYNKYSAFSTVNEIYDSTVGVLKNAANKYGDFETLYANGRSILDNFFAVSQIFERN